MVKVKSDLEATRQIFYKGCEGYLELKSDQLLLWFNGCIQTAAGGLERRLVRQTSTSSVGLIHASICAEGEGQLRVAGFGSFKMYTPRSGAFRKVKYPLPILQDHVIPVADRKGLRKIADAIRKEAKVLETQNLTIADPDMVSRCRAGKTSEQAQCKKVGEMLVPCNEVYTLSEEVYDSLYPENNIPPAFLIQSTTDQRHSSASDSESDSEPESDYDEDTEDEEWLEAHPEYDLSPSRFEYIFKQLNKRNTHVKLTALGALRPHLHEDFHKIFPYWKEKRLQNRNVSTWKPRIQVKKDGKVYGYVTSDPLQIFTGKPLKSSGLVQPKPTRSYSEPSSEEAKSLIDRVLLMKKKLLNLKSWAADEIRIGEHVRSHLVQTYHSLEESHSSHSVTPDVILHGNEPTGPQHLDENCNEIESGNHKVINNRPRRKSNNNSRFVGPPMTFKMPTSCKIFAKSFKKKGSTNKQLQFEDVCNNYWRMKKKMPLKEIVSSIGENKVKRKATPRRKGWRKPT